MSGASNYLIEQSGTQLLMTTAWTKPTEVWVALYTVMPSKAGTGGTEVSAVDTNYGRVQHGPGDAYWNLPVESNGIFSNKTAVQFLSPGPTGWGTVVGFGLWDQDDNYLIGGLLDEPKLVSAGDSAQSFGPELLRVTIGQGA